MQQKGEYSFAGARTSCSYFTMTVLAIMNTVHHYTSGQSVACICTSPDRDIYYTDVPFFGTQSTVDEIVDNLACMLQTPRHCLHVVSTGSFQRNLKSSYQKISLLFMISKIITILRMLYALCLSVQNDF